MGFFVVVVLFCFVLFFTVIKKQNLHHILSQAQKCLRTNQYKWFEYHIAFLSLESGVKQSDIFTSAGQQQLCLVLQFFIRM
jgi:hypothetical protein